MTDRDVRMAFIGYFARSFKEGDVLMSDWAGEFDRWLTEHDRAVAEKVVQAMQEGAQTYINSVIYDPKYGRDIDWVKGNLRSVQGPAGLNVVAQRVLAMVPQAVSGVGKDET